MIKTLYISTFINEDTYNSLSQKAKKTVAVSMSLYAELIRKGLEKDKRLSLDSVFTPVIGPYSLSGVLRYKPKVSDKSPRGKYLSCINIWFFKQFGVLFKLLLFIFKWCVINRKDKNRLIIYSSIQPSYLMTTIIPKLFSVKVALFVPDLPSMQYSPAFTRSKTVKLILPLYEAINRKTYNRINYYIFITKHMVSLFPPRPYSIMEGLIDATDGEENTTYENKGAFTIMYAGGLIEKMGVGTYLDAISLIKEPQVKFVFYGNGDMLNRIKEKSLSDSRIVYGGVLSHAEVLKKEKEANLLINPRPIGDKYTYYSFPSKLMEYMQSGTPVLTSRLAGIPDEYSNLMLYIEDSSVEGIAKSINDCLKLSQNSLNEIGKAASGYVKKNKNCLAQIERIMNNAIAALFN